MKISVSWVSPSQRTVLATFDEKWELADLQIAVDQMHAMIRTVTHDVSIIVWHRVPPHPKFTRILANLHKQQPANTRRLVIVPFQWTSGIVLVSTWINIIERLYPQKAPITLVKTIEEALKLCEEPALTAV